MSREARKQIQKMLEDALKTKENLIDIDSSANFFSEAPGRYVLSFSIEIPDFIFYNKSHWSIVGKRLADECHTYTQKVNKILRDADVQEEMILEEYKREEENYEEAENA